MNITVLTPGNIYLHEFSCRRFFMVISSPEESMDKAAVRRPTRQVEAVSIMRLVIPPTDNSVGFKILTDRIRSASA